MFSLQKLSLAAAYYLERLRESPFGKSCSKILSPRANDESWDLQMSPAEYLLSQTDDKISSCRKSYDAVGLVKKEDVNYENILKALGNIDCVFNSASFAYSFPQLASTDKAFRRASMEAEKKFGNFAEEMDGILKILMPKVKGFSWKIYEESLHHTQLYDTIIIMCSMAAVDNIESHSSIKRLLPEERIFEFWMRQDIFQNLLALQAKQPELSYSAKRYLERLIKNGKRNALTTIALEKELDKRSARSVTKQSTLTDFLWHKQCRLHLSEELQKEIKAIESQINDLCIQFTKNVRESNVVLEFTDEELVGLPEDFIQNLDKSDDLKRKVTVKLPHYLPVMQNAKNPKTRQQLNFAYNTQCLEENPKLLEQIAALRHKFATILGYPTYADYATDIRMSKTAKNVSKFLLDLMEKLTPLWNEEKKYMLELKEKECNDLNIPFDGKLNNWDFRYYATRVEEVKYFVDKAKLQEYFPLPVVTKGLLEIYQTLFGLKFEEIKDCSHWHPDVQLFGVKDAETGKLMGCFYLDLVQREGKYSKSVNFAMQPSCICDDAEQIPFHGVVTNFMKPTSEKPSLLTHDEVVTFSHQFGHTMHYMCSAPTFCSMKYFEVDMDFIEAPAQMLDNWCWTSEGLKRMSAHYQNQSPIPKDMVDALIKSQLANTGYKNLGQCYLAMFDHKIHTRKEADVYAVDKEVHQEFMGLEVTEGTCFPAIFQHLVQYHGGQYYGHLWNEVISKDMFQTCFGEKNLFNPVVGKIYRDKILWPTGSKDTTDMLKDFLGREPNQDAFLRCITKPEETG